MTEDNEIGVMARASDEPPVGELIKAFKGCGTADGWMDRTRVADDVRYNRWEGQDGSGKKLDVNMAEGRKAFPWDGASDTKTYAADAATNECMTVNYSGFWQAILRITGTQSLNNAEAAACQVYMQWLLDVKMRNALDEEVELTAQWNEAYGWFGIHTTWDREIRRVLKRVKLDDLKRIAQALRERAGAGQKDGVTEDEGRGRGRGRGTSTMVGEGTRTSTMVGGPPEGVSEEQWRLVEGAGLLAELVENPAMEDDAVQVLRFLYSEWVEQNVTAHDGAQGTARPTSPGSALADLSAKRARKAIRELREDGETRLPVPWVVRNQCQWTALKPWRDVVLASWTGNVQAAPYVFVRNFLPEVDVRANGVNAGWDETWIDAAVKTKGKVSYWDAVESVSSTNPTSVTYEFKPQDSRSELIEVVTCYRRAVDEDGVLGIEFTVFSPFVGESEHEDEGRGRGGSGAYAVHGLLDYAHQEFPVVIGRRERPDRPVISSRGVPELMECTQQEEKVQRDAVIDFTSIAVAPPLNIPKGAMGKAYKFGPVVQNEVTVGREPKLLEIPTGGAPIALEVLQLLDQKAKRHLGLFDETVPPAVTQMFLGAKTRRFLGAWAQALKQGYVLARQYGPEEISRVSGEQLEAVEGPEVNDGTSFALTFDVTQADPVLLDSKLKRLSELLPEDSEGVLDKGKLIQYKAQMIDPGLAKDLVVSREGASQQLFRQVAGDLVGMSDGNEPLYGDASNDPTAETRLGFVRDMVGKNPKYLSRLTPELVQMLFPGGLPGQLQQVAGQQPDASFCRLMEGFLKNLTQGVEQQKNKMRGRTGV